MFRPKPKSWSSDLSWDCLIEWERKQLMDQVEPIDGKYRISSSTTIKKTKLSFYPETVRILQVTDPNWLNRLCIYYLQDEKRLYRLNGTSPPIHEVNANVPIQLSESNVLAYLRFFGFFVCGDQGPFLIFESLCQLEIPTISNATERTNLEQTAYPARFKGIDPDGNFLASGMIWYGNNVFEARFKIHRTGMVEMIEDEGVLFDLDTRIEAPLS